MGLASAGFRVVVAENGAAGLDTFESINEEICLVIADVIMPGLSGLEMVAAIRAISRDVKIMLISGYADSVIVLPGIHEFPLIRKPFLIQDLVPYRQRATRCHSLQIPRSWHAGCTRTL